MSSQEDSLCPQSCECDAPACDCLADYLNYVSEIAVFDSSGFPQWYSTKRQFPDREWLQSVFTALCLQLLFQSMRTLGSHRYCRIRGINNDVLLLPQESGYLGLLLWRGTPEAVVREMAEMVTDWHARDTLLQKFMS